MAIKTFFLVLILYLSVNAQSFTLIGLMDDEGCAEAPDSVGTLSATGATNDITLAWTDVEGAEGYYIYRDSSGTTPTTLIDSVLQGIQTYLDSGSILYEGIYQYRLKAYNDCGLSAYSAVVSDTVLLGTLVYTSNFSADHDGWGSTRVTRVGNIDGISDGGTSYDDVLRGYASSDNSTHYFTRSTPIVSGQIYNINMKIYVPSGNTHVDGYRIRVGSNWYSDVVTATGLWEDLELRDATSAGTNLEVYFYDGTSASFIGADDVGDDLIYLRDIEVYRE